MNKDLVVMSIEDKDKDIVDLMYTKEELLCAGKDVSFTEDEYKEIKNYFDAMFDKDVIDFMDANIPLDQLVPEEKDRDILDSLSRAFYSNVLFDNVLEHCLTKGPEDLKDTFKTFKEYVQDCFRCLFPMLNGVGAIGFKFKGDIIVASTTPEFTSLVNLVGPDLIDLLDSDIVAMMAAVLDKVGMVNLSLMAKMGLNNIDKYLDKFLKNGDYIPLKHRIDVAALKIMAESGMRTDTGNNNGSLMIGLINMVVNVDKNDKEMVEIINSTYLGILEAIELLDDISVSKFAASVNYYDEAHLFEDYLNDLKGNVKVKHLMCVTRAYLFYKNRKKNSDFDDYLAKLSSSFNLYEQLAAKSLNTMMRTGSLPIAYEDGEDEELASFKSLMRTLDEIEMIEEDK